MAEALTVQLQAKLDEFLAGDAAAKRELIAMAERRLRILARKLLGHFPDSGEESAALVSEAFLRLQRALDEVRPQTIRHFFALASVQMKRVLLDLVRAVKRSDPLDSAPDPSTDGGHGGVIVDVWEAMDRLDDELREIVELLFFQGLTQVEVAGLLGVHKDTIKRKWAEARVFLARHLRGYSADEHDRAEFGARNAELKATTAKPKPERKNPK